MFVNRKKEINPLDKKVVDNIRGLSIDLVHEAQSGHIGISLGAAPILYTLYAKHLKIDIDNDKWINRDRFILSAGHASSLLYSILYMSGFNISLEDLKAYRNLGSITPGHPELNVTPGVDITTGPLGQGFANGVGIAISERYLNKLLGNNIIDYNTYVFCSDGDLEEGITYEAAAIAGNMKLNKLIVLYDSNDNTLDGNIKISSNEVIKSRFEAANWNYILVSDGEDINLIDDAINKAKSSDKPTIIEVKTTIGKYSTYEGTNDAHGVVLSEDEIKQIKIKLNLREIPFQISDEATNYFRSLINNRSNKEIKLWIKKLDNLSDDKKNIINKLNNPNESVKLRDLYYKLPEDGIESTRVTSGKIINSISDIYELFIGGSCDVSKSTYAKILNDDKNINYGVREHASAAIVNGIASTNVTAFTSTFLAFSDYMKPSIRMSAMMNLPVIYVFTHDSITVGEDGPTHQPIEQLIGLRSIPNLDVYRPNDANEVIGSYKAIFETRRPSAIILSRNKVMLHNNTKVNDVKYGAYIVKSEIKDVDAVIISCGEELNLALNVSDKLLERGIDSRVVSIPSIERFNEMDKKYKESIIPNTDNIFIIELSSSYSWYQFINDKEHLFTIDEYGASGNYKDILNKFNFNEEYICDKIEKLVVKE